MSTTDRMTTRTRVDDRRGGLRGFESDETKHSIKTTELIVFAATVAGVLIAAAVDDAIDAPLAWTLVTVLAIGYMLSRGIAKAGARHHDNGYGSGDG